MTSNLLNAIENTITESQIETELWLKFLDILSKTSICGFFTKTVSDVLFRNLVQNDELNQQLLEFITEFRYNLMLEDYPLEELKDLVYNVLSFTRQSVVDKKDTITQTEAFVTDKLLNIYQPVKSLVDDEVYLQLFLIRINLTHFLRCISRVRAKINNQGENNGTK